MVVVLHGLPDVPAAQIVYDVAHWILHLVPLHDWDARLRYEARQVEDLTKEHRRKVIARKMPVGREHGEDCDAIGNVTEIDEVHQRHHVVI